jgi:hypothetical protein
MASDGEFDEIDEIDPSVPTGTVEYWRARARQWEKRCHRAEREKAELISELQALREGQPEGPSGAALRRIAVLGGDVYPGTGQPPRPM